MYIYIYIYTTLIALERSSRDYSTKLATGKASEQTLFSIGWKLEELKKLNDDGRKLLAEVRVLQDIIGDHTTDFVLENVPRRLTNFRRSVTSFVKEATRHHRVAATHVFVIMISPEDRSQKPYAFPVQCLPYVGMPESTVRDLVNKVIKEMVARSMNVAGTVHSC